MLKRWDAKYTSSTGESTYKYRAYNPTAWCAGFVPPRSNSDNNWRQLRVILRKKGPVFPLRTCLDCGGVKGPTPETVVVASDLTQETVRSSSPSYARAWIAGVSPGKEAPCMDDLCLSIIALPLMKKIRDDLIGQVLDLFHQGWSNNWEAQVIHGQFTSSLSNWFK